MNVDLGAARSFNCILSRPPLKQWPEQLGPAPCACVFARDGSPARPIGGKRARAWPEGQANASIIRDSLIPMRRAPARWPPAGSHWIAQFNVRRTIPGPVVLDNSAVSRQSISVHRAIQIGPASWAGGQVAQAAGRLKSNTAERAGSRGPPRKRMQPLTAKPLCRGRRWRRAHSISMAAQSTGHASGAPEHGPFRHSALVRLVAIVTNLNNDNFVIINQLINLAREPLGSRTEETREGRDSFPPPHQGTPSGCQSWRSHSP